MERVMSDRVLKAFEANSFKPIRNYAYWRLGEDEYACGLSAVAMHEKGVSPESFSVVSGKGIHSDGMKSIGADDSYMLGFMDGWGNARMYANTAEWYYFYDVGFRDGVESWKAVVKAGLVENPLEPVGSGT